MFETEKAQNESKFAPAWITYFLQAMFPGGSENTERVFIRLKIIHNFKIEQGDRGGYL